MKTLKSILFLTLFLPFSITQSQTIDVGTKWINEDNSFDQPQPGDSSITTLKVTHDTIIAGQKYLALNKYENCGSKVDFLKIEGDQWYTFFENEKHLLYDFSLQAGDTLKIINFTETEFDSLFIRIDSTSTKIIDGISLKVQHISNPLEFHIEWGDQFIEHIGSNLLLFPQLGYCDPIVGGVNCVHYTDGITIELKNCDISIHGLNYYNFTSKLVFLPWHEYKIETKSFEIVKNTPATNEPYAWEMVIKDNNGNIVPGSNIPIDATWKNKVYFLDSTGNRKLWMDFSYDHEVGDTVAYNLPNNAYMYNLGSTEYQIIQNPYHYVINDIDSVISAEGLVLRRWEVKPIYNENDVNNCNYLSEITEGIGPTNGFFFMNCTLTGYGLQPSFRCFTSEPLNYHEIDIGIPCEIVGTKYIEQNKTKIYPNPIKNFIIIDSELPIQSIELRDTKGELVYKMDTGNRRVDTSKLPNGLYYLTITTKEGHHETHKIIKTVE